MQNGSQMWLIVVLATLNLAIGAQPTIEMRQRKKLMSTQVHRMNQV